MIDRFTEKAKGAIGLAADAAESLGHHYVGTEHLLIGLIQEGTGVAARVLDECGVKEDKVVELISELISPNNGVGTAERSTYTPGARKVIENSYREAVRFKAPLIGTEHILIAMIKENDCVASRLLNTMGVSIPWARTYLPEERKNSSSQREQREKELQPLTATAVT